MEKKAIVSLMNEFIDEQSCVSSRRTVLYYKDNLWKFYNFINNQFPHDLLFIDIYPEEITKAHFMNYIMELRDSGIKNTSVNTYTRAVRVFANWLVKNGYIEHTFADIKQLRSDADAVNPLTQKQADEIDYYLSRRIDGQRDLIIFYLMLDCGLRMQEVINLKVKDINDKSIMINNSKYNKSRIVPLPDHLAYLIDQAKNENLVDPNDYLVKTRHGEQITKSAITKMFTNIKLNTGIYVHPHLLRHTFATSFIAGGGNLEILRILLGHSDYNITQKYLHISSQMLICEVDIYKLDECFYKYAGGR